jgi:hypothetical protein
MRIPRQDEGIASLGRGAERRLLTTWIGKHPASFGPLIIGCSCAASDCVIASSRPLQQAETVYIYLATNREVHAHVCRQLCRQAEQRSR